MHVLCRDLAAASRLLHLAIASGYRESGISFSGLGTTSEKVLIAIRTTAVRVDVPLASYDGETRTIRPFGSSEGYLINLPRILNEKFDQNESRKAKLFQSLQQLLIPKSSAAVEETPDEPKTRTRKHGRKFHVAKNRAKKGFMNEVKIPEKNVLDHNIPLDTTVTI